MIEGVTREGKPQCTTTSQDSAYVPFSNGPLAHQVTWPGPDSKAREIYPIFQ